MRKEGYFSFQSNVTWLQTITHQWWITSCRVALRWPGGLYCHLSFYHPHIRPPFYTTSAVIARLLWDASVRSRYTVVLLLRCKPHSHIFYLAFSPIQKEIKKKQARWKTNALSGSSQIKYILSQCETPPSLLKPAAAVRLADSDNIILHVTSRFFFSIVSDVRVWNQSETGFEQPGWDTHSEIWSDSLKSDQTFLPRIIKNLFPCGYFPLTFN